MSSSKKSLETSQNGSFASAWHYILPLMQMVMTLKRGIHLAALVVMFKEEPVKTLIVIMSLIFSFGAQASNLANTDTTPLYFCQSQFLQAHIFRQTDDQNIIFLEAISAGKAPTPWLEESVSERANKTYTVYTSQNLILKITQDDSGFMPATLLISKNGAATSFELGCQLMYKIKEPR